MNGLGLARIFMGLDREQLSSPIGKGQIIDPTRTMKKPETSRLASQEGFRAKPLQRRFSWS